MLFESIKDIFSFHPEQGNKATKTQWVIECKRIIKEEKHY